jgi:large conductance mechanosensitive channel
MGYGWPSRKRTEGEEMLKEFKDFLMRGNIVELAVAFVMGGAFAVLVTSFVDDLVMPIVAMIFGKPSFDSLTFTINDAVFRYGAFITNVITFVLIAAAIFFFVVKPIQAMNARSGKAGEEAEPTNEERMVELLERIAAK